MKFQRTLLSNPTGCSSGVDMLPSFSRCNDVTLRWPLIERSVAASSSFVSLSLKPGGDSSARSAGTITPLTPAKLNSPPVRRRKSVACGMSLVCCWLTPLLCDAAKCDNDMLAGCCDVMSTPPPAPDSLAMRLLRKKRPDGRPRGLMATCDTSRPSVTPNSVSQQTERPIQCHYLRVRVHYKHLTVSRERNILKIKI